MQIITTFVYCADADLHLLANNNMLIGMSLFCFFSDPFFFPAILLFSAYFSEYSA